MEAIQNNWSWISSNPLGFAAIAALFLALGWGAAKLIYHERIEVLKQQLANRRVETTKDHLSNNFDYPAHGRHGKNLLSVTTYDAVVGQPMSLKADIPKNSKLQIALSGPPPQSLSDASGAWSFSVMGVVNWKQSPYRDSTKSPQQRFSAEAGPAEMEFFFNRPGDVEIQAFENDARTASWTKTVRVAPG